MQELFKYCPRCGSSGVQALSNKYRSCAACGLELFLNSSTAVGVIVEDSAGRILLLRRSREPSKGKLALPGGFVDMGESAEEALEREVYEETGLKLEQMCFLASFANIYSYKGVDYPTTDLMFVGRVASFDGIRHCEESQELLFVPKKEIDLDEIAFISVRKGLARYIEKSD